MPNPDGTRTKDEHRQAILSLMRENVRAGMSPDDALTKASADWQERLRVEGERKIALVERWLRGDRAVTQ